jgi:hypothetical protein
MNNEAHNAFMDHIIERPQPERRRKRRRSTDSWPKEPDGAWSALGRGVAFAVKVFIGGIILGCSLAAGCDLWWHS